MGTRSVITFKSKWNDMDKPTHLVSIYQQYDGYFESVGKRLCDFLLSKTLVNGIGGNDKESEIANGAGCLAAQFIQKQKDRVGGLYVTNEGDVQEFNYFVTVNNHLTRNEDSYFIEAEGHGKSFSGNAKQFAEFINNLNYDDDE